MYVSQRFLSTVRVQAVAQVPVMPLHSKGAVGVVLTVSGRSLVFVTCHLEAKKADVRRQQVADITSKLGAALGEACGAAHGHHHHHQHHGGGGGGFSLNEQFHHILWCGDFNYKLMDVSGGAPMPAEVAVKMLEDGLAATLLDVHDQLNQEKRAQLCFFGFREPGAFPDFFPTYKKMENRPPLDYADSGWVKACYRTRYKEPFYKGGKVKERAPAYCDRILFHSLQDMAQDLLPEPVPVDMDILDRIVADGAAGSGLASTTATMQSAASSSTAAASSSSSASSSASAWRKRAQMSKTIDNYRSINEGEGMSVSDHSPVCGTFLLRLRHDITSTVTSSNNVSLISTGESTTPSSRPIPIASSSSSVMQSSEEYSSAHALQSSSQGSPCCSISFSKVSLLPPGPYTLRISNIKLLWGTADDSPSAVNVLFPLPYEVLTAF